MKKLFGVFAIIAIVVATFVIANGSDKIPTGWFPAGSNPAAYDMGTDNSGVQSGKLCAYIKSKSPKENEFGTLMQTIKAENYLGKRLRLSGYLKSEDIKGWGGMWMRIDGENNQQLGFDNMRGRTIKGTTDWTKYEIVLDVPSSSITINYGVLLGWSGKIWFDNLKLEEVEESVLVTNLMNENKLPTKPVNLDFEE